MLLEGGGVLRQRVDLLLRLGLEGRDGRRGRGLELRLRCRDIAAQRAVDGAADGVERGAQARGAGFGLFERFGGRLREMLLEEFGMLRQGGDLVLRFFLESAQRLFHGGLEMALRGGDALAEGLADEEAGLFQRVAHFLGAGFREFRCLGGDAGKILLEGVGVAGQRGELFLGGGGDHVFEPLALHGHRVDGLLGGLGELFLEGVGMADEGGEGLLRGRTDRGFEVIDILAEGLLDTAGLLFQRHNRGAGDDFQTPIEGIGLFANRRQRGPGRLIDGLAQGLGVAGDALHGLRGDARKLLVEGLGVAGEGAKGFPGGGGKAFAQRFGVAGDAFHRLQGDIGVGLADGLDVLAEILDGAMGGVADMGAQGVGAFGHLVHGGAGRNGEIVSEAVAMRGQGLRESVARGAEQVLCASRFVAQALAEAVAEGRERVLQGRALNRDDLVQAVGLAFEPSGQVVGATADGLIEAGADVFQILRQGLRAGVDLFEEGVGESLQIAVDLDAARLNGVGSLLAGALEAFEQACGAGLKLQHHGVA